MLVGVVQSNCESFKENMMFRQFSCSGDTILSVHRDALIGVERVCSESVLVQEILKFSTSGK